MVPVRALGSEVRVTVLDRNWGVSGGRNAGIALARGEILFFLDDDAELRDPDTAMRLLTRFGRDVNLGIVGFLVIDATTGGAERRVFDSIGLYDASLFYAREELDLSLRALDAGFRILFDPSVTVMHHGADGVAASTAAYFYPRNRPWVALRHLPLPCCVTHTLDWWAWSLAGGVRAGAVGSALRGIRDCVAGMPRIWRKQRPVSRHTRRCLARNGGRLCH